MLPVVLLHFACCLGGPCIGDSGFRVHAGHVCLAALPVNQASKKSWKEHCWGMPNFLNIFCLLWIMMVCYGLRRECAINFYVHNCAQQNATKINTFFFEERIRWPWNRRNARFLADLSELIAPKKTENALQLCCMPKMYCTYYDCTIEACS